MKVILKPKKYLIRVSKTTFQCFTIFTHSFIILFGLLLLILVFMVFSFSLNSLKKFKEFYFVQMILLFQFAL